MAKPVVPPSKPPADKGKHIALSFPVPNVKEQSIKVDLLGSADNSSVVVSFDTFSPTKKYEKVISVPEPVCLRQMSKNVSSKNLSIILLKAAHAPPPSPASSPSPTPAPETPVAVVAAQAAAPAPETPVVAAQAAAPQAVEATSTSLHCHPLVHKPEAENYCDVHGPGCREEGTTYQCGSGCDFDVCDVCMEPYVEAGTTQGAEKELVESDDHAPETGQGKKKKKNKSNKKPNRKKQSKASEEEEEEQAEDKDVVAAREQVDRSVAELQEARSCALSRAKKALEAAEDRQEKAAQKVQHFEAELRKWQAHLEGEIAKWKAEADAAGVQINECKAKHAQARSSVESLEDQVERHRALVREAEERSRQRERQAALAEEERQREMDRKAQEEKHREQEERRRRVEEERQRAAEEKRRKEAERKENAKRREEERRKQEEEEERRKAERKSRGATPGGAATAASGGRAVPVFVPEQQKKQMANLMKIFSKDQARAKAMVDEELSKSPGGGVFFLCLAQCFEDSKDLAASGEALLKALAHPDADSTFSDQDRKDFAMKAMTILKDHPDKLCECLPLFEKLTPKYGILAMAGVLANSAPSSGFSRKDSAAAKAPATRDTEAPPKSKPVFEQPWRGPLIEEISSEPLAVPNGKPSPAASAKQPVPGHAAVSAAPASGWTLSENEEGQCWTLELPVPSIESLAEVNLDISGDAILLTPMGGGAPVARSTVPADANADEANARWSKKRRVLTIQMPRVS